MKARKENKVYSITTEQEKQRYLKAGYDVYSDDGKLMEYSPQKKVSYGRYDALRKENGALKEERLALRAGYETLRNENDTLREEIAALKEENSILRGKQEPADAGTVQDKPGTDPEGKAAKASAKKAGG